MFEDIEGLNDDLRKKIEEEVSSKFVERSEIDEMKKSIEALNNKNKELLSEKKKVQEREREKELEAEKAKQEAAIKSGDIDSLKASYEEKLSSQQALIDRFQEKEKKRALEDLVMPFISENVIDDQKSREWMKKDILSRLDLREDKPVVLDPEGNLTALTVDDLKKEFLTSSAYKSHLIGSNASGGGASGGSSNSGGSASKKFTDLSDVEKVALRREDPAEYDRLKSEFNQSLN